jgi:plasmid stabilization system protein ParE
MDREVVWNKKALESLDKIVKHIEEHGSDSAARKFIEELLQLIEKLRQYPEIGRKTKKFKTVRQYRVDKRRKLYYRKYGRKLLIVFLFDEKRDPSANPYK